MALGDDWMFFRVFAPPATGGMFFRATEGVWQGPGSRIKGGPGGMLDGMLGGPGGPCEGVQIRLRRVCGLRRFAPNPLEILNTPGTGHKYFLINFFISPIMLIFVL